MPICITNKYDCTGCGACWNICPKKCIKSCTDEEGFFYPKVDEKNCINCGLCLKVCPIQNKITRTNSKGQVYAAWSKDEDIRYHSTSGGVFSELAYSILDMGGLVTGAAYSENNLVHHVIVSNKADIEKIRQSKYIQSDIEDVYSFIRMYLKGGRKVLFCGAPCQVAGLRAYLQGEESELTTIDFVCRGMNSPKAYTYWIKELEEVFRSRVNRVWFKYKEYGWKQSPLCTRIDFENGQYHVENGEKNSFMQGYLRGNLYLRPSCAKCRFKGEERCSDITLADFWKIDSQYDDDGGTSMVMINSEKGKKLFEHTKGRLVIYPKTVDEVRAGNVCFDNSVKINPRGKEFLMRLEEKPFSELVKEYTKIPLYKKAVRKIRSLVKNWGG